MDTGELSRLLDEKLLGLGNRLDEKLDALEKKLDEKLDGKLRALEKRRDEKLERVLEEKLQPLWQTVGALNTRLGKVELKLDAVAETVQKIKYDTTKMRGRLNRVELEDLRADVDAIKATLGVD